MYVSPGFIEISEGTKTAHLFLLSLITETFELYLCFSTDNIFQLIKLFRVEMILFQDLLIRYGSKKE